MCFKLRPIIYKHFNICCFIAVAYTMLNRLRAVIYIFIFYIYICCFYTYFNEIRLPGARSSGHMKIRGL